MATKDLLEQFVIWYQLLDVFMQHFPFQWQSHKGSWFTYFSSDISHPVHIPVKSKNKNKKHNSIKNVIQGGPEKKMEQDTSHNMWMQ